MDDCVHKILNFSIEDEAKQLLRKSTPVSFPLNSHSKSIIHKLIKTFVSLNKGRGLAAPQIGYNKRIMLCCYSSDITEIDILINPLYMSNNKIMINGWEGCFSVPLTCAKILRWQNISVTYFDLHGNKVEKTLDNVMARIFQHEYDHLEGKIVSNKANELKIFKDQNSFNDFIVSSHKTLQ